MRKIALIIFIIYSPCCFSQDIGFSKDSLLHKICDLQCKGDDFFHDGLFASKRYLGEQKKFKYDNNIFFTALITYTLQSLHDDFTRHDQQIIDSIISRAKSNYSRYRNRRNEITYNFWQTHPDLPLPNNKFWSKSEKIKLPDDFDDTSIIFVTQEKNDSLDFVLKQKMAAHANLVNAKISSTFRRYKSYKAYNTWFGEKMKQDFDICVMSNTLLYIFQRGLELNQFDYETMQLIKQMVISDDYLNYPQLISPHYQNSSVILYHLSRLLSVANNEKLNGIRDKVIKDLNEKLKHVNNRMEKVILLSSLYRLDQKPDIQMDYKDISNDFEDFSFFVANPFSGNTMLAKRLLGTGKYAFYKYRCDAYNWTLILELQDLAAKRQL